MEKLAQIFQELAKKIVTLNPAVIHVAAGKTTHNMNLDIKNAIFWQRIKEHYENSKQVHICYIDRAFYEVWQWYARRSEILEFAYEFLKTTQGFEYLQTGDTSLFVPKFGQKATNDQLRQIRLEFIDYMITKTQHTT